MFISLALPSLLLKDSSACPHLQRNCFLISLGTLASSLAPYKVRNFGVFDHSLVSFLRVLVGGFEGSLF
ncbi:hypothetical protein GQ457_07G029330 [Hibiscus cannabinus]